MARFDLFGEPMIIRRLLIFADERKNINDRWHYLGLTIVPYNKLEYVLDILAKHKAS